MPMYKVPQFSRGTISINQSTQGETIEQKIERIVSNKEPIKQGDGAPLIFNERNMGVNASTDIRTDRFEIAIDATDKIAKSYKARREERAKEQAPTTDGKPEPIQGKVETTTADTKK